MSESESTYVRVGGVSKLAHLAAAVWFKSVSETCWERNGRFCPFFIFFTSPWRNSTQLRASHSCDNTNDSAGTNLIKPRHPLKRQKWNASRYEVRRSTPTSLKGWLTSWIFAENPERKQTQGSHTYFKNHFPYFLMLNLRTVIPSVISISQRFYSWNTTKKNICKNYHQQ